jgi:ribose-phosphate pyrophosphokinase
MKIESYPDGGKYVINDLNEESLIYRVNTYEDLFLLKSIKDSNPCLKEITIPCMFQQQHDRRFNQNESFELKLVCDFINSCNFKKVKVFHPHSDVTPALLNNCEAIDNKEFIANVILSIYLNAITAEKNCILMSSDAGGFKPLMKLCKQLNWQGETYSASKARDKDKLIQVIDRQDFGGKDILLIDDICVYGGTFIGLAKMLRERNVGKLYLAVSHITVENPNPEVFDLFDKVFTTNSKGLKYGKLSEDKTEIQFFKNLEIIKLF